MKISVCGKGGSGKSTVTTLLAKELASRGKKILVVDSDESNYGLHLQLGMELPASLTDYMGGKGKVMEYLAGGAANMPALFEGSLHIEDIPKSYYSEKDNIRLMTPGKIQQANEACACAFAAVIAQFLEKINLEDDEIVLMDMEAGTEHFGRGLDNMMDAVIMVVDPSMESLRLSKRIAKMSEGINKPIYFVLNKVTRENEEIMRNEVSSDGKVLAALPMNEEIQRAGLLGEELQNKNPLIEQAVDILLQK